MESLEITFAVEQNEKYGDYRVVKYINGIWKNERDGNWTNIQAEEIAEIYRTITKLGQPTMGDNI